MDQKVAPYEKSIHNIPLKVVSFYWRRNVLRWVLFNRRLQIIEGYLIQSQAACCCVELLHL